MSLPSSRASRMTRTRCVLSPTAVTVMHQRRRRLPFSAHRPRSVTSDQRLRLATGPATVTKFYTHDFDFTNNAYYIDIRVNRSTSTVERQPAGICRS
jgi:hypothetical protein